MMSHKGPKYIETLEFVGRKKEEAVARTQPCDKGERELQRVQYRIWEGWVRREGCESMQVGKVVV